MVYTLGLGEPVKVSVEQMKGFYELYGRLEQLIPNVLRKPLPKGPSDEDYEQQQMEEIVQRLNEEELARQEQDPIALHSLKQVSDEEITRENVENLTNMVQVNEENILLQQQQQQEEDIRVAIVGRPNVGKSTLINRLIDEDRLITGAVQGITRDAIPVEWIHQEKRFILTDTAGIRKRSAIQVRMERFSMETSLKTIRKSHVVCVVLDGSQHLTQQDARIIGFAIDVGKPLIVIANKWDLVNPQMAQSQLEKLSTQLYSMLPDLKGSSIFTLSAIDRTDATVFDRIGNAIQEAFQKWNKNISTSQLTEWLQTLISLRPPPAMSSSKKKPKLAYLTQVDIRPPQFVLFGATELPNNYMRFLMNGLRNEFDLHGVPIRLRLKGRTEK
ncbi:GTPase Der [Galdieria sulphuraria]|nr:GTPase Der [Galdieria sulphuraria]